MITGCYVITLCSVLDNSLKLDTLSPFFYYYYELLIQADAKLPPPTQLIAPQTFTCKWVQHNNHSKLVSHTHIYATIQVVLLVRFPARFLVTCLIIACMYLASYKWNCLHPWWNFWHLLCSMLTPFMPTRWGFGVLYNIPQSPVVKHMHVFIKFQETFLIRLHYVLSHGLNNHMLGCAVMDSLH